MYHGHSHAGESPEFDVFKLWEPDAGVPLSPLAFIMKVLLMVAELNRLIDGGTVGAPVGFVGAGLVSELGSVPEASSWPFGSTRFWVDVSWFGVPLMSAPSATSPPISSPFLSDFSDSLRGSRT